MLKRFLLWILCIGCLGAHFLLVWAAEPITEILIPISLQEEELLELKLQIQGYNVRVELTEQDQIEYECYDYNLPFFISAEVEEQTITVLVEKAFSDSIPIDSPYTSKTLTIRIPEKCFHTVVLQAERAGVSLPAMDVQYDMTGDNSAMTVSLPQDFQKSLSYCLNKGSGSLILPKGMEDFLVHLETSDSAIKLPDKWKWEDAVADTGLYREYGDGTESSYIFLQIDNSAFTLLTA